MENMKYFITYWAQGESNVPQNGIYEFSFDILKDNLSLEKAQKIVCKEDFGDNRKTIFINIIKI